MFYFKQLKTIRFRKILFACYLKAFEAGDHNLIAELTRPSSGVLPDGDDNHLFDLRHVQRYGFKPLHRRPQRQHRQLRNLHLSQHPAARPVRRPERQTPRHRPGAPSTERTGRTPHRQIARP